MIIDEDLASVHAYLCADGYVIKNPEKQNKMYYIIGFRNTNLKLLKDFQKRFFNYFKIKPILREGERCVKGSRDIYYRLTHNFGSFYSKEWTAPKIDNHLMKIWLRAFFDCEGWAFCKSHQNRHIGLDSINEKGIDQIKKRLEKLGIKVIKKTIKNRKIFRILIYGKENLEKYRKEIGFIHPDKKEKLDNLIKDFIDYNWYLKKDKRFVRKVMLKRARIRKPYYIRITSKKKQNLKDMSEYLNTLFGVLDIKIYDRINGLGTRYFELNINRKSEVEKLIMKGLINALELSKIERIKIKR